MKKSYQAIFALALLMVMGLASIALAAGPSITFTGFSGGFDFEPGSEYTETDLFHKFKGVMPGDTVSEEITFTNAATDCDFVNLYMRAVPHDEVVNALSEKVAASGETVATMTDFLAKLSMEVYSGEELIFSAAPNELDGLKENHFLGVFRTGETATLKVKLAVPIDLDNEYANRVGEVDWVFHVEAFNENQLSVRKVWSDGNANHEEDSISVNLLMDGEVEQTQVLNAENNWAYTFDRLVEGYSYSVEEVAVPEGYTVSYDTVGTLTTITNEKILPPEPPAAPLDIGVVKVWSNEDSKNLPDSVTVTLFDGALPYDSVRLGTWNNWSYAWKNLSEHGNWQVVETNIPKGYVPSYRVNDGVVTITNTRSLIQTGQLNWPIWVLGGTGLALIVLGGAVLWKKKKGNNA